MGVPQRRKRVFFIALRNDLIQHVDKWDMFGTIPDLQMVFKESAIKYGEIQSDFGPSISDLYKGIWEHRKMGDKDFSCINGRIRNKPNTGFGQNFIYNEKVVGTLTAKLDCMVKFDYPQYLSNEERCKIGSFPSDYNFNKSSNHYLIGMSVPPVMIAQIATRIYDQWLKNIPH
jgi:DNA (cytosine-5)-methyltransferase 1